MKNIICIDIDDCLISYYKDLPKEHYYKLFELNLERLLKIIEETNAQIFITSSWGKMFYIKNNNLFIKDKFKNDLEEFEYNVFHLLKTRFEYKFYGTTSGNRFRDIEILLKNNKVIAFDDFDIDIKHNNFKYFPTFGLVLGQSIDKAIEFFTNL